MSEKIWDDDLDKQLEKLQKKPLSKRRGCWTFVIIIIVGLLIGGGGLLLLNVDWAVVMPVAENHVPTLVASAVVPTVANLPTATKMIVIESSVTKPTVPIDNTATPTVIVPTATIFPSTVPTPNIITTTEYIPDQLAGQMLFLINQERVKHQLQTVLWDEGAAVVATAHAQDMVDNGFFSHWNQAGLGPDIRYAFAGYYHDVMENVHSYSYTFEDGTGVPIDDWSKVIENAHEGLMNSPGHRANILLPAHTHVGIGMAYDETIGQFRLAQEFTNQYVQLIEPIPTSAALNSTITIKGNVLDTNLPSILINLNHESFPQPMSIAELDATSSYGSPTTFVDAWNSTHQFEQTITFDYDEGPGLYHFIIFSVNDNKESIMLVNHVIRVE